MQEAEKRLCEQVVKGQVTAKIDRLDGKNNKPRDLPRDTPRDVRDMSCNVTMKTFQLVSALEPVIWLTLDILYSLTVDKSVNLPKSSLRDFS